MMDEQKYREMKELAARACTDFDLYGRHHGWCAKHTRPDAPCGCGLDAEKARIDAEQVRLQAYGNIDPR
jgi:hypothetical protein